MSNNRSPFSCITVCLGFLFCKQALSIQGKRSSTGPFPLFSFCHLQNVTSFHYTNNHNYSLRIVWRCHLGKATKLLGEIWWEVTRRFCQAGKQGKHFVYHWMKWQDGRKHWGAHLSMHCYTSCTQFCTVYN